VARGPAPAWPRPATCRCLHTGLNHNDLQCMQRTLMWTEHLTPMGSRAAALDTLAYVEAQLQRPGARGGALTAHLAISMLHWPLNISIHHSSSRIRGALMLVCHTGCLAVTGCHAYSVSVPARPDLSVHCFRTFCVFQPAVPVCCVTASFVIFILSLAWPSGALCDCGSVLVANFCMRELGIGMLCCMTWT